MGLESIEQNQVTIDRLPRWVVMVSDGCHAVEGLNSPSRTLPHMQEYFKNLPHNLIASNGNEIWTRHNQRPGRKIATVTKIEDRFKIEFEKSADSSERQLVTNLFGGD